MPKKSLRLPKKRTIEINASIFKRLLAFIIDLLIVYFIVTITFSSTISQYIPESASLGEMVAEINRLTSDPSFQSLMYMMSLSFTLILIIYFVVLEWKLGQTLGKMLFNVHVKSERKKLTLLQMVIRNLSFIFLTFFQLLFLLDTRLQE